MKQKLHVTSDEPLRGLIGRNKPFRDNTDTKPYLKSTTQPGHWTKEKVKSLVHNHKRAKTETTQVLPIWESGGAGCSILVLFKRMRDLDCKCPRFPKVQPLPVQCHLFWARCQFCRTQGQAWLD